MSRPNNNSAQYDSLPDDGLLDAHTNVERPTQNHQNDTSGQLNALNLAQVPGGGNRPGFERFHDCHAADESYYALARMQDRPAHEVRLKEQIRRVDGLMR